MLAVVGYHYAEMHVQGGYLGVTVFFVLSGYLISGLLMAEYSATGGVDRRAFYTRRALRLYPALIATVIGVFIVSAITGHHGVTEGHLVLAGVASLLYVNDFVFAAGNPTQWLDVTWSLGVEEQFYLVWPLALVAALRRVSPRRLAQWCFAAALLIGVAYVPLRSLIGAMWIGLSPIGSIMPLLLGAGLAGWRLKIPGWLASIAGAALVALVFLAPFHASSAAWQGAQQGASIAALVVIAYLIREGNRVLSGRALVWLGRRSYGIYLIHFAVYGALVNLFPSWQGLRLTVVGVPISVALAALSYRYVEQPFLRRKRRYASAVVSA